jgi:hypothetical protein
MAWKSTHSAVTRCRVNMSTRSLYWRIFRQENMLSHCCFSLRFPIVDCTTHPSLVNLLILGKHASKPKKSGREPLLAEVVSDSPRQARVRNQEPAVRLARLLHQRSKMVDWKLSLWRGATYPILEKRRKWWCGEIQGSVSDVINECLWLCKKPSDCFEALPRNIESVERFLLRVQQHSEGWCRNP